MRIAAIASACLLLCGTATAQSRMSELDPARMTPPQRAMYDAIMAGPRHSIEGPFNAWLRSPDLGDRLQRVGEYLRFKTTIPHNLNEFAILITAVEWSSGFEWYAHYPLAIKAGLSEAVAKDLQEGRRPAAMSTDEAMIYDFATQLHRKHQVSDAVYKSVVDRFGEQGITDLISVLGYYDIVSATLNVARVPIPANAGVTLPEPAPVTQ